MRLRLLILMGLMMAVATGCRKVLDDNEEISDLRLSVSPTIYGQKVAQGASSKSLADAMSEPAKIVADAMAKVNTRAQDPTFTKTKWVSGDKFSMFVSLQSDGKPTPISFVGNVHNGMRYDNLVYTYDGTQFSGPGTLYYPYRRAAIDLYGIYPYDAEFGRDAAANVGGSKRDKSNPSGYLWNVFANQDAQGSINGAGNTTSSPKFNVEQGDLLYAHNYGVLPSSDGLAQPLVFKHVMSKVFVKLLVPKEFNGQEFDENAPIVGFRMLNTYLEGLVDFRADSVYVKVAESATPITLRPAGSLVPAVDEGVDGTYYFFEGIAIPQWVEGGRNFFQIEVKYKDGSGAKFTMRLGDGGQSLYSGKEHTMDLVFDSKVGLRLNGSYIKDWVEGDGGGGLVGENDALPASNSFIVSPGAQVILNCMLAGNDIAGTSTYSQKLRAEVKSVRLLWQTKSGHTTGGPLVVTSVDDSKLNSVRVQTNALATEGGNAVIAAYSGVDGTGSILWSWHLWISPEKIDLQTYGDKFVTANGVGNAMMDRNLGALSATASDGSPKTGGMLYQWGRKDPFTGSSTGSAGSNSAIEVYDLSGAVKTASLGAVIAGDNSFKYLSSATDNVTGSVANPMTFYTAGADWTTPSVGGLWGNYGIDKGIFDPCPKGYRVASSSPAFATGGSWADLGDNGGAYGVLDGDGATLIRVFKELGGSPAYVYGGWRGAGGVLSGVASGMSVHSSGESSDLNKRLALEGNLLTVSPFGGGDRWIGSAVRCVQDNDKTDNLSIVAPSSIPSSGGSAIVKVYTNIGGTWSASVSGGAGISVAPSGGTGNGMFSVIATSAGTAGRTATVTVKNGFGTIIRTARIVQIPATTTIAGVEWCNFNLAGNDGQSAAVKLESEPQGYGKFFKWGDTWVYQRGGSSTDGDWTTATSGASTVPAASYTGGLGNDYIFGLSGGRASGDPCQKLGAEYFTPTRAQWKSVYGTGSKWGSYQGVNGIFMGPTAQSCTNELIADGSIFLPAPGLRSHNSGSQSNQSSGGYYWSSSVLDSNGGYYCYFASGSVSPDNYDYRGNGFSVRCVRSTAPVLALSATAPGETVPKEGKTYTIALGASGAWSTSEATGVTVSPTSGTGSNLAVTITVAANAGAAQNLSVKFNTTAGTPTQTITWAGEQAAAGPATVLVGGAKWTTGNLTGSAGTATGHAVESAPQGYGMFFKWGTFFVYQRASNGSDGGGWGAYTTGAATSPSSSSTSGNGYDYGSLSGGTNPGDPCQKLGASYKTPTHAQWVALNNTGSLWSNYNNIPGRFFGPKASSCNNTTLQDGCIFLPASGYRYWSNGSQSNQGGFGYYWSSSVYNSERGWSCYFGSGGVSPDNADNRGYGFSVRCVQE